MQIRARSIAPLSRAFGDKITVTLNPVEERKVRLPAMRFHGLFIGVDRYQAAGVNWLSSAVRDATALHALFTDSFGGNTSLLVDGDATGRAIRDELAKLATRASD